jgi:excisionase family DNA binding protein
MTPAAMALARRALYQSPMAKAPNTPRRTSDELCTVDFAAGQLKLHPKTVLRFIHEGRLAATRVGKAYRILRADLDAFGGVPARAETEVDGAWVTSIVDIPGVGPDLAQKWARVVPSALDARPDNRLPMRAEVIYEAERSHLKIVLVGGAEDTVNLLSLIRVWLEQLEP